MSHTFCKHIAKAAQAIAQNKVLSKSVSEPKYRQKRKGTIAQHCLRAIAGEVVNQGLYI